MCCEENVITTRLRKEGDTKVKKKSVLLAIALTLILSGCGDKVSGDVESQFLTIYDYKNNDEIVELRKCCVDCQPNNELYLI